LFFEPVGNITPITFYILPGLNSFDGIIGDNSLKELNAVIDRKRDLLTIEPGIGIPLVARKSKSVYLLLDNIHSKEVRKELNLLLDEFADIFEPLSPGRTVRTSVRAEIRTTTQEAVYSKPTPTMLTCG